MNTNEAVTSFRPIAEQPLSELHLGRSVWEADEYGIVEYAISEIALGSHGISGWVVPREAFFNNRIPSGPYFHRLNPHLTFFSEAAAARARRVRTQSGQTLTAAEIRAAAEVL